MLKPYDMMNGQNITCFVYSTGFIVMNLESMNTTVIVTATKQTTNVYHVSSSKMSVKAGTLL